MEWYNSCTEKYRSDYKKNFDTWNKYLLLSIGGGLVTLISILEKSNTLLEGIEWIKIFILIEILLFLVLGVWVLYGLFKEIEICEEYIEIYNCIYNESNNWWK